MRGRDDTVVLTDADVLGFYDRAADAVYRYAIRLTAGDRPRAQDLVQDTFLTLIRQVRAGRAEPVGVGWAITTCRSRFLDQLRRQSADERARQRGHETMPAASADLGVFDALARVPEAQRAALIFRYVDDLSVAQVAQAMHRSVRAIESLLARGRDSLRDAYQAGGGQ